MGAAVAAKKLFRTFHEVRQKKSLYQKIREYRGFVPLRYETDDYLVTTAQTGQELLQVLELRHEVFLKEWQNRTAAHGLDVDQYDFKADHLLIYDKNRKRSVGTYRLLSSHFTHDFYSASEFELDEFLRVPAVKLEMGRACVHPEFRDGNTIDLLWKGLARYIDATKTEYLFGCSSLKTIEPALVSRLYRSLRENGSWVDDFHIRATWDYQFQGFTLTPDSTLSPQERRDLTPPLLRSYLLAGARVHGWPALDADFACTDLLTVLHWPTLNPKFLSRYLSKTVCG